MQINKLQKKSSDLMDLEPINDYPEYSQDYYGANDSRDDNRQKQQLLKYLKGLRRHGLAIAAFALLITALAIVYEAQKPDYYKASVRIQINNEINPGASGSSVVVANPGNDPTYFTTQLQILEGPGLLRRVVKTIDLENNEAFFRSKVQQLSVTQNVLRMFGLYKPAVKQVAEEVKEKTSKNNMIVSKDSPADPDKEAEQLAPYVSYLKNSLRVSPVKDNRTAI